MAINEQILGKRWANSDLYDGYDATVTDASDEQIHFAEGSFDFSLEEAEELVEKLNRAIAFIKENR